MVWKKLKEYLGVMKLTRIELEQEAIVVGEYCEIIINLMEYVSELSLVKLYTFAFLYNKSMSNNWNAYNGQNSTDVIYKCLSSLSGAFDEYCKNITFIIRAVDILCKADKIQVIGGYVKHENKVKRKVSSSVLSIIYKALDESSFFTDRQFLKEVIRNV